MSAAGDSAALSEVEYNSDSDWLDIASNRESEVDTDSALDESDRDPAFSSRRSSVSLPSPRPVDRWEGLIPSDGDEQAGELPAALVAVAQSQTPSPASAFSARTRHGPLSPLARHALATEEDLQEDERVCSALDQSMIGTLSSSRSSAHSHSSGAGSGTDLRLSFPDPLTSSRDELNRSYEDVSSGEDPTQEGTDSDPDATTAPSEPLSSRPGSFSSPTLPDVAADALPVCPDLHVVLYGAASDVKWAFVTQILEKAAMGAQLTLTQADEKPRSKVFHIAGTDGQTGLRVISIIDRTVSLADIPGNEDSLDTSATATPSLAIIYLPSYSPDVSRVALHSHYLPVIVPREGDNSGQIVRKNEQLRWNMLGLAEDKVLRLSGLTQGRLSVIQARDIESLQPAAACEALETLLKGPQPTKKRVSTAKQIKELPTVHVTTILAIFTLVIGYIMSGTAPEPIPTPTHTATTTPCAVSPAAVPVANHSAAASSGASVGADTVSMVVSSMKDFAVSMVNPASTTTWPIRRASVAPGPSSSALAALPGTSTDLVMTEYECSFGSASASGVASGSGTASSSHDLVIRAGSTSAALSLVNSSPATSLAVVTPVIDPATLSRSQSAAKGKGKAVDTDTLEDGGTLVGRTTVTALSAWLLPELSKFERGLYVLGAAAEDEMHDLTRALDDLARALVDAATDVVECAGRGRAALREPHQRAKDRAHAIRAGAGNVLNDMRMNIRGWTEKAKRNARQKMAVLKASAGVIVLA